METKNESISSLKFAEYNPRAIQKEDFEALKRSIREYGFVEPVVCNKTTGRIVGGHMRVRAAQDLGITEVPVVWIEIPEVKEKALNLALNRIHGEWDEQMLAELIYSIKDEEALALTGFNDEEISKLLDSVSGSDEEEDEAPPLPSETSVRPGDLYELGNHRVLCGDATKIEDIEKLMNGQKARMVFTDPPYNVDYKGGALGDREGIANDKMKHEEFEAFLSASISNMFAVTQGAFYICMSSSELHTLFNAFTAAGGHWSTYIIWAKSAFTLSRSDYHRQFEPILYGMSETEAMMVQEKKEDMDALPILYGWNKHAWYGGRKQGDVWQFDKPSRNKEHPTMKPIALCAKAIKNSSKRGDIVLDVFSGSFSTMLACEKLGRTFYGMELDGRYVDVGIRRLLKQNPDAELKKNGEVIDKTPWLN